VLSICTGASILARAGILDGHNATTNKKAWKWVTSTGPNVDWVAKARWVDAGKIWSSSGVSAGIDMTLAWVSSMYSPEIAKNVSINLEYQMWDKGAEYDPFAEIYGLTGAGNGTTGGHGH
jgi:transcriptional regulator GlxA family with amidase domain